MTRPVLAVLVLAAALAPSALAQSPRPVPGGAGAAPPVLHDGRVVFAAPESGGRPARLIRLDPATGRTTETPLPGSSMPHTWEVDAVAGGLFAGAISEEYERTPIQAVDAAGRLSAVPEPLASMDAYDLTQIVADGARALGSAVDGEGSAFRLVSFGPGGAATPLEPLPGPGERTVYRPTVLGDAVYYVVQTVRTSDEHAVNAVWRSAGGTAAPLDVLPPEVAAHNVGLAAVGGALLITTTDRDADDVVSRMWRLAPGAARAVPVAGVTAATDLSQEFFRGFGDAYLFTMADDEGRVHLWRGSGTAAPARVDGLDLGNSKTFYPETVRLFDGALYAWGVGTGDDQYGSPTRLYRVDPAAGAARPVARYRGAGFPRVGNAGDRFVVAGGRVYFVLADDSGENLVSLPIDTAAPAAPRRSTRRRR